MARSMDELLGLKKTKAKHDFKVGDKVKTNSKQKAFAPGREGEVIGFDQYNLVQVKIVGFFPFMFHHKYLDRI